MCKYINYVELHGNRKLNVQWLRKPVQWMQICYLAPRGVPIKRATGVPAGMRRTGGVPAAVGATWGVAGAAGVPTPCGESAGLLYKTPKQSLMVSCETR